MLVVQSPYEADVIASMRDFVRCARKLRSTLLKGVASESNQSVAVECSFFIAIVGVYFGQKDLADQTDDA